MKRIVAGLLWFAVTAFAYEIVWSVTGVPRAFGPMLAIAAAAMVVIDPLHLFWVGTVGRSTKPIAYPAPLESLSPRS